MPDWPHALQALARLREALDRRRAAKADARGAGKPGRKPAAILAVDAYQAELESLYAGWAERAARNVLGADPDDRGETAEDEVAGLVLAMQRAGRMAVPNGLALGLGDTPPPPLALVRMARLIEEADGYLAASFGPAAGDRLRGMMDRPGLTAGELADELRKLQSRAALYAGPWWAAYNVGVGARADDAALPVFWGLDPYVTQHCQTCLAYGDRQYASFETLLVETGGVYPAHGTDCGGNCRCGLKVVTT